MLSMALLVLLAVVASDDKDLEHRLVQLMTPCSNACSNLTRYGRELDGGYLMCQDVLSAPHGLTAALSFGIKGRDSWGIAVSGELGLPVHEFDCFNTNPPAAAAGAQLHFNPTCIGNANEVRDGRQYKTVAAVLDELRPQASSRPPQHVVRRGGHLLLKMDVEGDEWPIFAALPRGLLGSFRQFTFELHGVSNDGRVCRRRSAHRPVECWPGVHNVSEVVSFLEILNRHFVLVSHHGNNWWGAHNIAGRFVPDLTEMTYVHRHALPAEFACVALAASAINNPHVRNNPSVPEVATLSPWTGARQGMGVPSVPAKGRQLGDVHATKEVQPLDPPLHPPLPPRSQRPELQPVAERSQLQTMVTETPAQPARPQSQPAAAASWEALQGRSAAEILNQNKRLFGHLDPLRALSEGLVPARLSTPSG